MTPLALALEQTAWLPALAWCVSTFLVALPLVVELVAPRWQAGARGLRILLPCLLVLLCATLPGGSALAAATVVRSRTAGLPVPPL